MTRYHLDNGVSYAELFRAVHKVDQEFENGKTSTDHQTSVSIEQEVLRQLEGLRKDLGSFRDRIDRIETSRSSQNTVKQPDSRFVKKDSPRKKGKKSVYSRCGRSCPVKGQCLAQFHVKGQQLTDQTLSSRGEIVGANQDSQ